MNSCIASMVTATTLLIAQASTVVAQVPADKESSDLFQTAINTAQQRTAKIYGASVGRQKGYATGIIVSGDGKVLTAQGVFLSGSSIRVVLPDGSVYLAKVLKRDDSVQAALLQLVTGDGNPVTTPNFFEINKECPADKGDWLLAVTNLFKVADGPERLSVNLGIVSLRTMLDAKRGTQDIPYHGEVLLIDAITANPGAPGGAAVTADGQLAGMVGRRFESKTTGTALNYVVPSDALYSFVNDGGIDEPVVVDKPKATGDTGIRLFTLAGKRAPAYIERVKQGSSADQAGLRKDDLVLSVGGEIIRNVRHFQEIAKELPAGEEVIIIVKRGTRIVSAKMVPAAAGE
ncbi:MAG: S1C family serine protease [Pirellulales bacterium]|nr:S1C family serine protease [Pirellulales bacterium]